MGEKSYKPEGGEISAMQVTKDFFNVLKVMAQSKDGAKLPKSACIGVDIAFQNIQTALGNNKAQSKGRS